MMKKQIVLIFLVISIFLLEPVQKAFSFWVWTPETNRWINPKYSVKDTPQEQLEFGQEFYKSEAYKKAMNEFRKLIKYYPQAKEAAEAQFYIGLCLEQMEKYYDAYKAHQRVIDKYPFSSRTSEIVGQQYHLAEKMLEGEGKRNKIIGALIGGEYEVVEIFKAVIKNAPYGDLAAPSQYKIGLFLKEKGLFQDARDEFEKVLNDYPDSEWVNAAKYQIALVDSKRSSGAAYDQKVTQAAVQEFQEFLKENPDAELSEKAKKKINELKEKKAENNYLVAYYYEKQKAYDAAKVYYLEVVENFQETSWAVKALERLREIEIKKSQER